MKNTNRISLLMALTLSITHISCVIADEKAARMPQHTSPVSILDDFAGTLHTQLDTLYNALSGISSMISDGQVSELKNKQATLDSIRELNKMIQSVVAEKFVIIDPNDLILLTYYSRAIMLHVHTAIKNGFQKNFNFNVESYPFLAKAFKKSIKKEPLITSLEQLRHEINLNGMLLQKFIKKSEEIGLTWVNKRYRTINNWIIEPCQKYSVVPRAALTTATTSFLLYSWWRFRGKASDYKNNPESWFNFPKFLLPLVGSVATDYEHNGAQKESNLSLINGIKKSYLEPGWLARFDHELVNFKTLIVGGVLYQLIKDPISKEWARFKPWISNKISTAHNKLLGGAYLKKANKMQGIIEEVHFSDLVGVDHVKETFQQIISYLENPEPFDRLGIAPPKGILLIGESRTGKSYSVRALFTELNKMLEQYNRKDEFKFFDLPASLINSEGIGFLLRQIKECAPCIVFIDEIDLLDLQRRGKNDQLSELLTCMSGCLDTHDSKKQVIIIGATNRPENMDIALRQPGRFEKEIRFEFPSFKERSEFIIHRLNKLSVDLTAFDIEKLSRETENITFEGLKIMINNAVLKSRLHGDILSQQYLEDSVNEILRNIITQNSKGIPEHERRLLATHFAGHGLALQLLDTRTKLSLITIKPYMTDIKEQMIGAHLFHDDNNEKDHDKRIEYGNIFTHQDTDTLNIKTKQEKLNLCKFYLAGIVAEEIMLGGCSYDCHSQDKEKAFSFAKDIVFAGLNIKQMPKDIEKEKYQQALELLETCKQEITAELLKNKDILKKIIEELLKKESLHQSDISALMKVA